MANILVVDDEEYIRRMLSRMLSGLAYTCILAADGGEARKCLDAQPFDLALLDVNMPGESGVALTKYIVSEYEDTAVILLTGVDDPKIADAAIEAGAYDYIIKPFNPNELTINIRNALHRRKLEIANRIYRQDLEQLVEERTASLQKAFFAAVPETGGMARSDINTGLVDMVLSPEAMPQKLSHYFPHPAAREDIKPGKTDDNQECLQKNWPFKGRGRSLSLVSGTLFTP